MGFHLMDAACSVPLMGAIKQALFALAHRADDETGEVPEWRSAESLATDAGLKKRTFWDCTAQLEELGHVSRDRRPGKKTIYRVHPCTQCTGASPARVHEVHGTRAPNNTSPVRLVHSTRAPDSTIRTSSSHPSDHPGVTQEEAARANALTPPPATPSAVVSARPSQGRSTNVAAIERDEREGPRKARGDSKGTRIPEDFALTDGMRAWARQNTPDVDVEFETAEFIDFWHTAPGAKGRKADWPRTWQVRMREMQRRIRRPQGTPMLSKAQQQVRNTVEAAAEVARDLFGPDWKPA